jgi:hypothetical protein
MLEISKLSVRPRLSRVSGYHTVSAFARQLTVSGNELKVEREIANHQAFVHPDIFPRCPATGFSVFNERRETLAAQS